MQYSITQIISKATSKLQEVGLDYPQLEARILLQHALNKPHEYLLANPDEQLNYSKVEAFEAILARRLNHEPVAYITGIKEFYSREFIVNKHVLIPRADTELLVDIILQCYSHPQFSSLTQYNSRPLCHSCESVNPEKQQIDSAVKPQNDSHIYSNDLENWTVKQGASKRSLYKIGEHASSPKFCRNNSSKQMSILELGTGSGCIAITLLLELPYSQVTALDISPDAIEVAKNNAMKHKVADRLKIVHSDWFENIANQKFDFIVSNPPYISVAEKTEMAIETIGHEPHLALFAKENGLLSYKIIAENAKKFLKQNGKLALEIGYNQREAVGKIFLEQGYNIEGFYKDLQGHDRVILLSPIILNRSYARRIGKSLSDLQQNLLDRELPKYLFSKEKLINFCEVKNNYTKFNLEKRNRSVSRGAERTIVREHPRNYKDIVANFSSSTSIFLEIGFGMGEHLVNQAKMNPESLFIGAEVYLNGVANVLKLAAERNITNFLLFPNNLDFILHTLPNNSLDGIYILFPDPWVKNKQKKKRILNKERLKILQDKLKKNGNLVFASDIADYFNETVKLISQNGNFKIINENNYAEPHDNYIITKYHQKAIEAGRQAKFIVCTNVNTG